MKQCEAFFQQNWLWFNNFCFRSAQRTVYPIWRINCFFVLKNDLILFVQLIYHFYYLILILKKPLRLLQEETLQKSSLCGWLSLKYIYKKLCSYSPIRTMKSLFGKIVPKNSDPLIPIFSIPSLCFRKRSE